MQIKNTVVGLAMLAIAAFAQSDRGTITGTISDPAGAVVASAPVELKNVDNGQIYQAATSATGNFTLTQLPAGPYELSVTVPGFKKFVRQGLTVGVAQTYRVDVTLEVGAASESVTVTEAAPLLKTESGELSHVVEAKSLNNLPVLGIGAAVSASGVRTPYAVIQLLPGAMFNNNASVRINGTPNNSQAMRIEGQDATNGWYSEQSQTQGSVDAMQEFAVQTSNYAAEFGQAGGGVINITMKSGTNQFHGGAYDYMVNEALNSHVPFVNTRPRQRRHDWGFTFGGPVTIPKIFDGRDKAFFFFSFEQYRETTVNNNISTTVPTPAYRMGDFGAARTGRTVFTDGLGRSVQENTIYDPATDRVGPDGLRYRDLFPNNVIPLNRLDPVALRIQDLIPMPQGPNAAGKINNYLGNYTNPRRTNIPSLKGDYQLSSRTKLSGFWSLNRQFNPNVPIIPGPLRSGNPMRVSSKTGRINFDHTITPTMLLHVGVGLLATRVFQPHEYRLDPVATIGLRGTHNNLLPNIGGLSNGQGGMGVGLGSSQDINLTYYKPTGNVSLTWVRSNHTLKFGGEVMVNGYINANGTYAAGWMTYHQQQTGMNALSGVGLPAQPGFQYGSFLLGGPNNGIIAVRSVTRFGSHALSGFVQDTWKVTRKLTLDYGLRYDFATYLREGRGLYTIFSASTPNPSAGGRLGATANDGYGDGRCNCALARNYPYGWGPRLGVAYQVTPRTVLRGGFAVIYNKTDDNNIGFSSGSQYRYNTPSYADPAYLMRDGLPYQIRFPNFDPGQYPLPGTIAGPPQLMDPNAGRPARQVQYSFSIQREIVRNLLADVGYVGNVGAWWNAADLVQLNSVQYGELAHYGLDPRRAADRQLLGAPVNSSIAAARGFGSPFATFPTTATVAQSLRPYPQFDTLSNNHWVPIGNTWYNSLQAKLTKRFSHGLDFSSAFTWQKSLVRGVEDKFGRGGGIFINDPFNRANQKTLSAYDQPFQLVFAGTYTTPVWRQDSTAGKMVSWLTRDWQLGTLLRYASGMPLLAPQATTNLGAYLFSNTLFNRVPGEPLFTQDLNCHCFDPRTTFVLNPNAWVNPALGEYGVSAAYYTDYRRQRRPVENLNFARNFVINRERNMQLQVRVEFTNIFNRTQVNDPTSTNARATQSRSATTGLNTAGFGWINTGSVFAQPRQGLIVARFSF